MLYSFKLFIYSIKVTQKLIIEIGSLTFNTQTPLEDLEEGGGYHGIV